MPINDIIINHNFFEQARDSEPRLAGETRQGSQCIMLLGGQGSGNEVAQTWGICSK